MEAATQIFYSMGLGFGGKIFYYTKNKLKRKQKHIYGRSLEFYEMHEDLERFISKLFVENKICWLKDFWKETIKKFLEGISGLIAFGSYNPEKNNCKKDVLWLSLCNLITSLYMAIVIFCVLGYMGVQNYNSCIKR